jgi:hypothetical protein
MPCRQQFRGRVKDFVGEFSKLQSGACEFIIHLNLDKYKSDWLDALCSFSVSISVTRFVKWVKMSEAIVSCRQSLCHISDLYRSFRVHLHFHLVCGTPAHLRLQTEDPEEGLQ